MSDVATFGILLKYYRLRKNLKLRSFARSIGESPGNYCNYESGARRPPLPQKLEKLAYALCLNEDERMAFYRAADRVPPDALDRIAALEAENAELRKRVEELSNG